MNKFRIGQRVVALKTGELGVIEASETAHSGYDVRMDIGSLDNYLGGELRGVLEKEPKSGEDKTVSKEENKSALSTVISEKAEKLFYGLRLNRLSSRQRLLHKHDIVDGQGYLTALGVRVYLDYLWQKDEEGQKAITEELEQYRKDEKDADK